jgi:hypothetical protein
VLRARLVVSADSEAELDVLRGGCATVEIVGVDVGLYRDGTPELLSPPYVLTPLMIEACTPVAANDPELERRGPLVRVHVKRTEGNT